jgi:hypothetical protein
MSVSNYAKPILELSINAAKRVDGRAEYLINNSAEDKSAFSEIADS